MRALLFICAHLVSMNSKPHEWLENRQRSVDLRQIRQERRGRVRCICLRLRLFDSEIHLTRMRDLTYAVAMARGSSVLIIMCAIAIAIVSIASRRRLISMYSTGVADVCSSSNRHLRVRRRVVAVAARQSQRETGRLAHPSLLLCIHDTFASILPTRHDRIAIPQKSSVRSVYA